MQYFLRNNQQYKHESDLNDLGREFPSCSGYCIIMMSLCITSSYVGSRMQKHWFKVTSSSSEDVGMQLLTTVRGASNVCECVCGYL